MAPLLKTVSGKKQRRILQFVFLNFSLFFFLSSCLWWWSIKPTLKFMLSWLNCWGPNCMTPGTQVESRSSPASYSLRTQFPGVRPNSDKDYSSQAGKELKPSILCHFPHLECTSGNAVCFMGKLSCTTTLHVELWAISDKIQHGWKDLGSVSLFIRVLIQIGLKKPGNWDPCQHLASAHLIIQTWWWFRGKDNM